MNFVRDCADVLVGPLTTVFNHCIEACWMPDEWKVTKITPIHKKGPVACVKNYRPISNLCTISKVLERCVLAQLENSEEDDDIQHGFRKGHSTTTAALEV